MITVGVVMVAYGDEPLLHESVSSVLASRAVDVEVVLVDNGADPAQLDGVRELPGVTVLRPGTNLGFAGGCNLGAAGTEAEVVVLFNCDATMGADTLGRLVEALEDPSVGIATASVRLADDPAVMNSAGNPVHYLGLAWAGGHGRPAAEYAAPGPVSSASGACCAVRHDFWDELGGFDEAYFAYHEDVELSLRCWQRGRSVVYVPDAIALHHYEFHRNPTKTYLLERNRLLTVLTTYSGRSLALLAPALLAQEVAMLAVATAQGWLPAKASGYGWLLRHAGQVWRRHRDVQTQRRRTDRQVLRHLATRFDAGNVDPIPGLRLLNSGSAWYGKAVLPWL